MDDGAKLWMMKYARRHFWRVSSWCDLDDLIQDGYMTYYRIVAKYCYPRRRYITQHGQVMPPRPKARPVKDRPHLMALFKLAFAQHIDELAKRRTAEPEMPVSQLTPSDNSPHGWLWDTIASESDPAQAAALAPWRARAALDALELAPQRVLRSHYRVRVGAEDETLNERLCKILGLNHADFDLVGALFEYLHEPSMI
jgi:hypothetical protein